MSEIFAIWASDAADAVARLRQITLGRPYRVLRRGSFALAQAEDADHGTGIDSNDATYCIVFEMFP